MTFPYGNNIKLYINGTSHGPCVSARLCGLPAGIPVPQDRLAAFMARRAPGTDPLATPRKESDRVIFTSGISDGFTDGGPLCLTIENGDARPSDYDFADTPRPSHADYAAVMKYGPGAEISGGGHFSGRLTAPLCAAGFVCLQYLESRGVRVLSHVYSVADVKDDPFDPVNVGARERERLNGLSFPVLNGTAAAEMRRRIEEARADGDSVGGIVECAVCGLPAGLGEHLFAGGEGRISAALFSIPAVKGVEFGSGFSGTGMRGSENNDPFVTDGKKVFTASNNAGGILGGMTTGMPLIFRAAFKPTPSIAREQDTVSLSRMAPVKLTVGGRHDPCIVLRAAVVVEAAAAAALCDLFLDPPAAPADLAGCRRVIDTADVNIVEALSRRMEAVRTVGELKKGTGSAVYAAGREISLLTGIAARTDTDREAALEVYGTILDNSRRTQRRISDAPVYTGLSAKRMYLIGEYLGHSLSPQLHALYGDHGYSLRQLKPEELPAFFAAKDFDALNVTIPYKKTVIPFLDELSPEARETGAVNTVIRRSDGALCGFNTDVYGFDFLTELSGVDISGRRCVILGNGGAAAAVRTVLSRRRAGEVITAARHGEGTIPFTALPDAIDKNTVLINATPVGMFPETGASPLPDGCPAPAAAFDLIYNPWRTALACALEKRGVPVFGGAVMLAAQAARSFELLTGLRIPEEAILRAVRKVTDACRSIVLIGMPGCGKTTAARTLARVTDRRLFDTDADVSLETGYTPEQYIRKYGEDAFRRQEHLSCVRASHLPGAVIAAGGGAVTREENLLPLRTCGVVVRLTRPLDALAADHRPLTEKYGVEELARQREPAYRRFADLTVEAAADPALTAERILNALREYDDTRAAEGKI